MVKVLVVDDEQVPLLEVSSSLKRAGYEVKAARSGDEALALAQSFRPEVLVTDFKLKGGLDGGDVVRRLVQQQPRLKSVVFSGVPVTDLKSRCVGLPVSRFLGKPFSSQDVVRMVRELAKV